MNVLWANRKSRVGVILLAVIGLVSLYGALGMSQADAARSRRGLARRAPPVLGTTLQGQDVFTQTVAAPP